MVTQVTLRLIQTLDGLNRRDARKRAMLCEIPHPATAGFGMTARVSAAGADKAVRSIRGIAHKFRKDDPAQCPLFADTAGMMSILPRRRTNISPRSHRFRASPTARRASLDQTRLRLRRKEVAVFARDFPGRPLRQSPPEPSSIVLERNRKFSAAE